MESRVYMYICAVVVCVSACLCLCDSSSGGKSVGIRIPWEWCPRPLEGAVRAVAATSAGAQPSPLSPLPAVLERANFALFGNGIEPSSYSRVVRSSQEKSKLERDTKRPV